ncbi:MAG: hypothetical protein IJW70_04330 [Clostridia bacterium]|nr:hypothetical protein [Clostridia bacterium]
MPYSKLPPVRPDMHTELAHFPSRFHAAVFRLWETVPAARIAYALNLPREEITKAAHDMGLPLQCVAPDWETRGYITTIRNAWHVLPYESLLRLLDWDEDKLATVLKEDDFIGVKLGNFKPYCEPITLPVLNEAQKQQLAQIRQLMQTHFADLFEGEAPFTFFRAVQKGKAPVQKAQGLRMIYSYCGLYATALEHDISLSYPDTLLAMYRDLGVNAIWLPAVLYQIVPFSFDESYSEGWQQRQERLRELIAHAGEYGIKVYLYLNEPRCMPNAFFDAHPELVGRRDADYSALCTQNPAVMEYLRSAVRTLCSEIPGLGGFFVITCSENLTHCKSKMSGEECPVCRDIPIERLVAQVLCAISEESRAVDPSIRTIAWTWAWDDYMTEQQMKNCMDLLPSEIVIQSNSEALMPFERGGVSGHVRDYSISVPGPAPLAKRVWEYARARGHQVCAKVQVNASWECSTLPYLPVFDLIREHMTGLREAGVEHLMLSWTLGGYPSISLKIASECLQDPSEQAYLWLLEQEYGEYANAVRASAKAFSDAFRHFPFDLRSLYFGPQNPGPSNLLYPSPSGYIATMTCYSYDALDTWRAIYPREVYLDQWRKLSEGWHAGVQMLKDMPDCEYKQMAKAANAIFASCYAQVQFILAREQGDTALMQQIAAEEMQNALDLYALMQKNPHIGYEAANHYYYNKGMLAEKVINCAQIAAK